MVDLQELEAIKRLKYRYIRLLDQKRWPELAECFTSDAVTSYSDGKYSFQGIEAIMKFLMDSMSAPSFHSSHHVHHPEIEITSPITATGIWAMRDEIIEIELGLTIRGAAFYEDEYVKVDGEWRISRTGYRRIFEEMQDRSEQKGLQLTASMWATDE
ncbi:MAG: nuclear transport factor 2 family protein [Candidatus Krumholzibacteriia bacterium]